MSDYRRYFVPGGTFFFTLVTERRARLFADDLARDILGSLMRRCLSRYPIDTVAIVLLPDHLHAIWTLPGGDRAYSMRWRWIKREFTRVWLAADGGEATVSQAQRSERRRGVWQRRFWEHTIRDDKDLESHFDYLHFNPVKHGYVSRVRDWPWSSFHRWVRQGHYQADWGGAAQTPDLPGNAGE
jgi:putative transposase